MDQHSGPATLLRGFEFPDRDALKTPEPFAKDDTQIPSPPRPRLRLRRRVASQLTAPTQQFLASVAAADIPIPSIEEPEITPDDYDSGRCPFPEFRDDTEEDLRYLRPRGRGPAAPKTPVPELPESLPKSRYPDWTINSVSSVESTPEPDYESSRPSTARSTLTSASLFSRFSQPSEDDEEDDVAEDKKECFPALEDHTATQDDDRAANPRSKARKAPWTKAMSDHLWSTFMLYLQDPKVTPFRMGKNGIPPQGVCNRVAREAKRSWKGSKALSRVAKSEEGKKSGSATPTADSSGTFIQWPHTCAATRAHLRELCRLRANSRANNRFAGPSTTPFSQAAARHWNRRSTPARSSMPFTTQDMSLSLVMSTAESMQPNGPLAQLAKAPSTPEPASAPAPAPSAPAPAPTEPARPSNVLADPALSTIAPEGEPSFAERRRLGSPFTANSYGPSSSGSLAAVLGLTGPMPRRQTQTVGPRRTLQSPVRLSRAGTQKRRHTQSGVPRKRPSIGSDLWLDPNFLAATAASATLSRETASSDRPEGALFVPKMPSVPTLSSSTSMPNVGGSSSSSNNNNRRDDSALQPPPRLGSPFMAESSSFSFPHRVHRSHQAGSIDLGVLGRPFAMHAEDRQSGLPPPPSRNASLADRLAYIDQRLKELRQRERGEVRRRSESPF
ncbi:hypothetical protein VTJ04DRAFT_1051 [Mycothermus thermophilus]|uniref:uncharacterized protein n=1 Tax=Humicola insolens TaxID=85995 RepID=UPI003742FFD6